MNAKSLPEGTYRLLYLQLRAAYVLSNKTSHAFFENLLLGVEPQYNRVWIDSRAKEWEAGMNFFLQSTFRVNRVFQPYYIVAVGPHYFSTPTVHQSQGFVFSDSMGIGTYVRLHSRVAFHINFRIRHLSNANTRFPNHGINTYNFHCGWVW